MLVVKVPGINAFGRTKGTRNSGEKIIAELEKIFSNEKGMKIDRKLLDVNEINLDNENLEEQENKIYENSRKLLEKNEKIIFLGGDHSISFPIGKSFLENCNDKEEEACLIVFDAHADCMPAGKEASHEEWLRALIDSGFKAENILLVGSRNNDAEEIRFLAENKIKQISINELLLDLENITDLIMEFSNGKELYVSFDIDVIDPAFAPATGYKEPGGLSSREAIYIVSRISRMKNLKVFDLVEVDAVADEKYENITTKLGAKLLAELL